MLSVSRFRAGALLAGALLAGALFAFKCKNLPRVHHEAMLTRFALHWRGINWVSFTIMVQALLAEYGMRFIYLPPYSPGEGKILLTQFSNSGNWEWSQDKSIPFQQVCTCLIASAFISYPHLLCLSSSLTGVSPMGLTGNLLSHSPTIYWSCRP